MMRDLVWWILVLVAVVNHTYGRGLNGRGLKTIEKRQICSNNNCNSNVCDGRNCNSCNSNSCCSSVNCNSCVNQCTNNCNTPSCKNNCVSGCSNACEKTNCDTSSCSQCVSKCNNQCSTSGCVSECARNNCDCTIKEKETNNDSIILVPSGEGSKVIVNNTNNNLVNLTTHININNVVHNFNNISIPVFVNTTNINNINLSETSESHSGGGNGSSIIRVPYPVPMPYPITRPEPRDNCCYVLHPRQCHTDENGNRRCTQRRSRECSDACTSPVVSIEEGHNNVGGCQRVNSWPYNYCGNYVRRDCDQCYTCGGSYNPSECFRQTGCSENCRRGAPICVPSQNGLQCS